MKKLILCLLMLIAGLQEASCYGYMFPYMEANPEIMAELDQLKRAYRDTDKYKELDRYDTEMSYKLGAASGNIHMLFEQCKPKWRGRLEDSEECLKLAAAWSYFDDLNREIQGKKMEKKLEADRTPEALAYFRKSQLFDLTWRLSESCDDKSCQD